MAKSISRRLADSASPTGAIDGTLSTAAQTNITSVGTLSSLAVTGEITANGGIDVTGTATMDGLVVDVSADSDSVATITSTATANNTQLRLGTNGNDSVISGSGGSNGALAFKVFGTERMRIDSAGSVGIGTGSPDRLIDLRTAPAEDWQIRLGANNTDLDTYDIGRDVSDGLLHFYGNQTGYTGYVFDGINGERMRIDSSGNVGIGTDSPANPLSISVQTHGLYSQHRPSNSNGVGQEMYYKFNTANGTPEIFSSIYSEIESNTDGAESGKIALRAAKAGSLETGLILIGSTGNVGIGTTSPTQKLEVAMTRTSSTSGIVLQLSDNVTGAQTDGVYKAIRSASNAGNSISEIRFLETDGTNNNTSISFATAAAAGGLTERVRINQLGNVGIGTDTPSSLLELRKTTAGFTTSGTGNKGAVLTLHHEAQWESAYGTGGSTPDWLGAIDFSTGDGSAGEGIRASIRTTVNNYYNTNDLAFYTANQGDTTLDERMRIKENGNVGIGTASPASKLHISNNGEPADDLTLLTLENGNGTGDIGTPDTWIDFVFKDTNANVTPQARIGAHAGDGGDANTQILEGKGYLTFHTSGTGLTSGDLDPPERMRIDSSGIVTMPYQPFIRVRGNNASMVTNQGTNSNPFDPNWYTVTGRGITESNGVFTVPQAGTYLIVYNFYFWVDNSGNGVTHSSMLYHNSTGVQEQTFETGSASHSFLDNTKGTSFILNMAAGDTFKFSVNADIYGGATHTTACAYMLG